MKTSTPAIQNADDLGVSSFPFRAGSGSVVDATERVLRAFLIQPPMYRLKPRRRFATVREHEALALGELT